MWVKTSAGRSRISRLEAMEMDCDMSMVKSK